MQISFRLPRPETEPVLERHCAGCGSTKVHIHQHEPRRRIVMAYLWENRRDCDLRAVC